MDWTDAMNTRLKVLWNEGKSCEMCAREMSREFRIGFTRNAVMGKVHRLRLAHVMHGHRAQHGPPRAANGPPIAPRVARVSEEQAKRRLFGGPPAAVMRPVAVTPTLPVGPPPAPPRPRRFLELKEGQCRFPYGTPGTPDFYFCGAPAGERPYCPAHCDVCYQPLRGPR